MVNSLFRHYKADLSASNYTQKKDTPYEQRVLISCTFKTTYCITSVFPEPTNLFRGSQLESASLLLAAFRFANVMSHLSASQNVNILLRLQLLHAALQVLWSSPRPISDSQLHALPHFHLCPIYLVVFKGSYSFRWDISS